LFDHKNRDWVYPLTVEEVEVVDEEAEAEEAEQQQTTDAWYEYRLPWRHLSSASNPEAPDECFDAESRWCGE
jgi:hypothetical protein